MKFLVIVMIMFGMLACSEKKAQPTTAISSPKR